jgi:hypothetical protein
MEYALAAIIGWCGTGWPIRFPGGGGGGWDPSDPWPDNCPVCGMIIGAIAGVVIWAVIGPEIAGEGLAEILVLSFFGGSFGSSLVRGITGLGKTRVRTPNV